MNKILILISSIILSMICFSCNTYYLNQVSDSFRRGQRINEIIEIITKTDGTVYQINDRYRKYLFNISYKPKTEILVLKKLIVNQESFYLLYFINGKLDFWGNFSEFANSDKERIKEAGLIATEKLSEMRKENRDELILRVID